MTAGLRTELRIDATEECPVAALSARTDTEFRDVRWTDAGGTVVEECRSDAENVTDRSEVERVFEYGNGAVYRFEREEHGCPCELVEALGVPTSGGRAVDGALYVTLHLESADRVREVIGRLHDNGVDASVRGLCRTVDGSDATFVDRGRLTDRQTEVLRTAHGMGYFEHPRGANTEDVAAELGIHPSTLAEHLAAAQAKLLGQLLAE